MFNEKSDRHTITLIILISLHSEISVISVKWWHSQSRCRSKWLQQCDKESLWKHKVCIFYITEINVFALRHFTALKCFRYFLGLLFPSNTILSVSSLTSAAFTYFKRMFSLSGLVLHYYHCLIIILYYW